MKKLTIGLLAIFIIFSCKNVDQYRAPIDSLTAEWTKAGENVMNTYGSIGTSKIMMNTFVDSFKIDSTKKWSKEALIMMDSMKTAFVAQYNGINKLSTEVEEFKNKWTTMTADVDALSKGLKEGKLEGDVMVKINDLKANCQMAVTQSEAWNKNVTGAQTTVVQAWDLFKKAKLMK
ncbi:MAG: hypothetical protein HOP11_15355 [Saprospiraceae bacterium]|nr:hypothetical protein [Saprospiraceae bacterium]